jgi:preprotein translocase subunit SecD
MKRLSALLIAGLFIAGCQAKASPISFRMTFDTTDEARQAELVAAARNVIALRSQAHEGDVREVTVDLEGAEPTITAHLTQVESAIALENDMIEPLKFRVMREAEEGEEGDLTVQNNEKPFVDLGMTEDDLDWVTSGTEEGKGTISIMFTEAGAAKLEALFEANEGKHVGLFVRDQLASIYVPTANGLTSNIVIKGIPSAALAAVFADDLNVGSHITFTPIK